MTDRHYNLGSDATYTDFFASVTMREQLSLGYGRYGQEDPFLHYRGMIDDVRIYDTPLTATEVDILYTGETGIPPAIWLIY